MLHSCSLTICSTVLFFHWIHIRKFLLWLILCSRPPAGSNSTFRKLPERCSIYIEANKIVLLPFFFFLCNQPTSDLLHSFYIKRSILSISSEPHYQPQPSTRMCMLTSSEQNHRKTGLAANQPAIYTSSCSELWFFITHSRLKLIRFVVSYPKRWLSGQGSYIHAHALTPRTITSRTLWAIIFEINGNA